MTADYSRDFYSSRDRKTRYSARAILGVLFDLIQSPSSAIDIGCGVGTWLATLSEMGVADLVGVDGAWVDTTLLRIPHNDFHCVDLATDDFTATRRYDLCVSLEVAEHLPPARAASFVAMLTHLSDLVLFSAAIPHQGGRNHLNEQWQDYWVKLFHTHGYICRDVIRGAIWTDSGIPYWYRQNTLLFQRVENGNQPAPIQVPSHPLNIVHPDLYLKHIERSQNVPQSLRWFLKSAWTAASRRWSSFTERFSK